MASGYEAADMALEDVSGSGLAAAAMGCSLAAGLAYKVVRPWFKIWVNCHFCNCDSKVKYNDQNSWYCPYCGQYNGFTVDGDYNQETHLLCSTPYQKHKNHVIDNNISSKKVANNGFCKKCNLNQELKISQLASFCGDEAEELEEYRAHLERVYRLCAECEDVLSGRLEEQNNILTPGLIEHRLETSRLIKEKSCSSNYSYMNIVLHELRHVQFVVAFMYFMWILNPDIPPSVTQSLPHIGLLGIDKIRVILTQYAQEILQSLVIMLAVLSFVLWRVNHVYLLNILPVVLGYYAVSNEVLVTVAFLLITLVPFYPSERKNNHKNFSVARKVNDSLSAKMIALDNSCDDLDETLTSHDSCIGSKNSSNDVKPTDKSVISSHNSIGLFTKLTGFVNSAKSGAGGATAGKRVNSPLIWSGDENTLNHEFFVETSSRGCDLTSLNLGEEGREGARTKSPSPFTHRIYSPQENPDGIRFTGLRPIIRPAQLTSWVAGGYWSPPETKVFGETLSRSSSQSSGFVSTGLVSGSPSVDNFSQMFPSTNYASLPTSPRNSILGDYDRNSVLSAPTFKISSEVVNDQQKSFITQRRHTTDDKLSDYSLERVSQLELSKLLPNAQSSPKCSIGSKSANLSTEPQLNNPQVNSSKSLYDRLSFTITITPTIFVLGTSLTINCALICYFIF